MKDFEVFAERELRMVGADPHSVFVRLGRPRRQETGEWGCPVQILGLGRDQHHLVFGEDSMQALQIALSFVATMLRGSDNLTWSDSPADGTGFHRTIPETLPPALVAPIEAMIEEVYARWDLQNAKAEEEEAAGAGPDVEESSPWVESWVNQYREDLPPEQALDALLLATAGAFRLGRFEQARAWAEQLLNDADWRAHRRYGEALHMGHTVLGLLALRASNEAGAVQELLLSAATPGSAVLRSSGPSMRLARALLIRGHTAAVLEYLGASRRFWERGGPLLEIWEDMISAGKTPRFVRSSYFL
jgi:hypothetical protein